ncbi:MAG: acyl-CoA desaturase [Thermodesulfobacteriota bacterium]
MTHGSTPISNLSPAGQTFQKLRFLPGKDFESELKRRVNKYFLVDDKSKHDSALIYLKAIFIFTWTLTSYGLLVFYPIPLFGKILCALSLSLSLNAIGFNIVHDGAHQSFSKHPLFNNLMAASLDLIGGSSHFWRFKHNYLHHTYPNITGYDDDINVGFVARFSPFQRRFNFHKYQHIYMWFFYGLIVIKWQLVDDFQLLITRRIGSHKTSPPRGSDLLVFIIGKINFVTFAFVIPFVLYPITTVLFFYIFVTYMQGVVMSVVFQLAHCIEETEFPSSSTNTEPMKTSWVVHQIETTADFARQNRLLNWYVGGLNFQVEHHLYPTISHIHYPAISKIVENTCREYDVRYFAHRSFTSALGSHYRWLHSLGTG